MKKILISTIAMLILAACAQNQHISTMYYWGDFQRLQYEALTEKNTPEEQITNMEKYFIEVSNHHSKPAPGAHAHLGMLYAKIGNRAGAREQFEQEKQLFHESATYMDFLLKKINGNKEK